jgi:hypothetical protein
MKDKKGSRLDRKLSKYSNNFNEIFTFFLQSYRHGILTFCGSHVNVEFDVDEIEGKNTFRKFDNGQYKNGLPIITRHPNIVKGVIIGKKAWGLWLNNWAEGIVDWTFTKEEIIEQFTRVGIKVPDSLMKDFDNRVWKLKMKRNDGYMKNRLDNKKKV